MKIQRYAKITESGIPREIILLKSLPCNWGKCSFCDYIHDNSNDINEIDRFNAEVIQKVSGGLKTLQVINSGSCFEIPPASLQMLKSKVVETGISRLIFEAHWMYRHRLGEMRAFFQIPVLFITGIETFDDHFRNGILKKGINFSSVSEVAELFDSVCLMVGIKGQTREMIKNDINIVLQHFKHATINLYNDNSTGIKADKELQTWFRHEYSWLADEKKIDVLFEITDFGVGTILNDE